MAVGDVIVVTGGPPGAGKSAVSEALAGLLGPSALVEGFRDLGAAEHMWHEFEKATVDPRHVIRHDREPAEAAELAGVLGERIAAGTLRYP
jgi:cytidylate kinase